jgi:4a-hydroxytetrahydrobiopterin dehydratase
MKSDLVSKHCEACEGIGEALSADQVALLIPQLDSAWEVKDDHKEIQRSFKFANFYETMAFINGVAWIANKENHHPDLAVGYNYCTIRYSTHALQGLTHNDFICAAKVDALF